MSGQRGLTIITKVLPGRLAALQELLDDEIMVKEVESNPVVPFERLARVHFLRWFLLDAPATASSDAPSLVFSSCFDGTVREHLDELLRIAGPGVTRLYAHCEGFPGDATPSAGDVRAYLERHRVAVNTLYIGTRGFTVERIRREAVLYDALQAHLDTGMPSRLASSSDAAAIRAELQRFVRSRDDFAWVGDAAGEPRRRAVWPQPRDAIPVALALSLLVAFGGLWRATSFGTALLAASGIACALVSLALWTLRRKEASDREAAALSDARHVRELTAREDFLVQNQLSSVTVVKPGPFRRTTLRVVLSIIDVAARYKYTHGKLGTIPSIHYARWIAIEKGRRLLFLSNFDGSWESYLGDFIDKAAAGLTAVWSNAEGFPRTRWLTRDGARDEQRFKAYTRTSQVPTQVWYSAYKHLTVIDIRRNGAIREGVFDERDDAAASAWLALL